MRYLNIKNFIINLFQKILRGALDLIYPARCELCGNQLVNLEKFVCRNCSSKLPIISTPHCPICYRSIKTRGEENRICGYCKLDSKRIVEKVVALYEYRDGARELIHKYKYDKYQSLAEFLAENLFQQVNNSNLLESVDWIVSIPLHWTRKRWRGFNQADKLAKYISKKTGVPLLSSKYFKRIKKTTPQVTLNAEHRKKNIRGAFKLNKKIKFENSSIILVDDVLTTGATSNECARIFKKAGAKKVHLIVLAR